MRTSLENQAAIKINRRPLKFYCAACAKATHFCHVCAKHINQGELCYSEFNWRSFLAKTRRYYCLKCYEEIFMTPEAPLNKIK